MSMTQPQINVDKRYPETGLPQRYRCGEVEFDWTDWVLCEIAWRDTNPIHHCIASSFRGDCRRNMTVTVMHPSYEEVVQHSVRIDQLAHFVPVRVIHTDADEYQGEMYTPTMKRSE